MHLQNCASTWRGFTIRRRALYDNEWQLTFAIAGN